MTRIDLASEKERVRRRVLQLRDQQTIAELETKSLQITESIFKLPEYRKAKTIASYVDKGSEAQTKTLIRKALSSRKKVLVPIVDREDHKLLFSQIRDLKELAPGSFGILEPKANTTRISRLENADLMLVPGIAWDVNGYRIGWGKGYFDIVLKQLPDKTASIGLAFEIQLVDHVPHAQFDLPVKILVTEKRVAHCHD